MAGLWAEAGWATLSVPIRVAPRAVEVVMAKRGARERRGLEAAAGGRGPEEERDLVLLMGPKLSLKVPDKRCTSSQQQQQQQPPPAMEERQDRPREYGRGHDVCR